MTTEEMRAVTNIAKRWSVILGLAIMLGTVCVPVAVWALDLSRWKTIAEKQLGILEAGVEDSRATFRMVCVMASDSIKVAAGSDCPQVYPQRRRRP